MNRGACTLYSIRVKAEGGLTMIPLWARYGNSTMLLYQAPCTLHHHPSLSFPVWSFIKLYIATQRVVKKGGMRGHCKAEQSWLYSCASYYKVLALGGIRHSLTYSDSDYFILFWNLLTHSKSVLLCRTYLSLYSQGIAKLGSIFALRDKLSGKKMWKTLKWAKKLLNVLLRLSLSFMVFELFYNSDINTKTIIH